MIKISCLHGNDINGVHYFRCAQPLMFLQKFYSDRVKILSGNDKSIMDAISESDIYFHESPGGALANIIPDFIKKHFPKVKIVYDYDDAPWTMIPPYHPAYFDYGTDECEYDYGSLMSNRGEKLKFVRNWKDGEIVEGRKFDRNINLKRTMDANALRDKADFITTSTHYLARWIEQQTAKPVDVLPNFIEPALYNKVKDPNKKPGEVRIGWIMGYSHLGDMIDLLPAIIDLLNERKNVKFYLMGPYTEMLVNILKQVSAPVDRFIIFPSVKIESYFNVISHLDLDVGIMHLKEDDVYNKCKSPLKFLEMTALQAACLAPETLYGDYIQNEKTGLIYANRGEFNALIRRLIDNEELRKDLSTNAKKATVQFTAHDVVPQYLEYFEKIMVTK